MGTILKREPFDGLGNHIYLEKQDKLREIGVDIPTSQVSEHREGRKQRPRLTTSIRLSSSAANRLARVRSSRA